MESLLEKITLAWLAKSPVTDRIKKLLSFLGIPPDIHPIYHPLG